MITSMVPTPGILTSPPLLPHSLLLLEAGRATIIYHLLRHSPLPAPLVETLLLLVAVETAINLPLLPVVLVVTSPTTNLPILTVVTVVVPPMINKLHILMVVMVAVTLVLLIHMVTFEIELPAMPALHPSLALLRLEAVLETAGILNQRMLKVAARRQWYVFHLLHRT